MQKVSKSLLYFSLTDQIKQHLEEIIERNSVIIDDFAKSSSATHDSLTDSKDKKKKNSSSHKKKKRTSPSLDDHDEIFNHLCWELENEAEMNPVFSGSLDDDLAFETPNNKKNSTLASFIPLHFSIIEKRTFFEEKKQANQEMCSPNVKMPDDDMFDDENKENVATPLNMHNSKQPILSLFSSANKNSSKKNQFSNDNSPSPNPFKKSFLSNFNNFTPLNSTPFYSNSTGTNKRNTSLHVLSPTSTSSTSSGGSSGKKLFFVKTSLKTLPSTSAAGNSTKSPSSAIKLSPALENNSDEIQKIQKKTTVKNASGLLIQEWHNNLVSLENDTINLIEQLQDFISRTFLMNREQTHFEFNNPLNMRSETNRISRIVTNAFGQKKRVSITKNQQPDDFDTQELLGFGFNDEEIEIMRNPQYNEYVKEIIDREFFEKKSAINKAAQSPDVNNLFSHEKKMEHAELLKKLHNSPASASNNDNKKLAGIDYNIIDSNGEKYNIEFKLRNRVYKIISWIIKDLIRLITKKYSGFEDQEFFTVKKQWISEIEEELENIKEAHENCFASLIENENAILL